MKSTSSDRKIYFCTEPWTGGFSVQTNLDVKFCSCYLNTKIGNLRESSIEEIWNSSELQQLRRSFSKGQLPRVCEGQLCPVALGHGPPVPINIAKAARGSRHGRWRSRQSLRHLLRRISGLFSHGGREAVT